MTIQSTHIGFVFQADKQWRFCTLCGKPAGDDAETADRMKPGAQCSCRVCWRRHVRVCLMRDTMESHRQRLDSDAREAHKYVTDAKRRYKGSRA